MESYERLSPGVVAIAFFAVCLGTFLYVLDYSVANVAIPYIAGDLGVSNDQGTYVITAFAAGNAIALPLTGWLANRIGSTKLLTLALATFTILSFICGASFSIGMLVTIRFLQGVAAGPLVPLGQSFITRMTRPETRPTALGIFAMVVLVAPVLGPIVGGYICINYHWGWIFYINIPLGVFATIVIYFTLKPLETPIGKMPLDYIGLILLAIGVTCLQIMLDKGQQWNWFTDPKIRVLSIGTFLGFLYLIIRSLTYHDPFIDLTFFRFRTFTVSCILIFVGYSLYFGTVVLIPLWLQAYMGYNAFWAGLAVAPIGCLPVIFGAYVGRVMKVIGKVPMLVLSFSFFGISCYYVTFFNPQVDFFHISFSRFLLGGGMTFLVTPLLTLVGTELNEDQLPMGTGIFHFIRALSGGIGTSIYTTIWDRRITHQHLNFASHLNEYTPEATEYFHDLADQIGTGGMPALDLTNTLVDKQASVFALCETFHLMTIVSIVLILISFIAIERKSKVVPGK